MGVLWQWVGVFILGLCLLPSAAMADVEGARKAIDAAAEKVKGGDFDAADTSLEIAAAELEGVDATAADPIKQQIEAMKKQIAAAKGSEEKQELTRQINSNLKNLESQMDNGNFVRADEYLSDLESMLNDAGNKALLGDEAVGYLKQISPIRKVVNGKLLGQKLDYAEARVKSREEDWAETVTKLKDPDGGQESLARSAYGDLEMLAKVVKDLPSDNDKVKALDARVRKMQSEFDVANATAANAQLLESIKGSLSSYQDEFGGWEQEASAVTFKEYMAQSGADIGELNMPKTAKFISRYESFLKNLNDREDFKTSGNTPEIKAFLDETKKKYETAHAKMLKGMTAVVEEAEKTELTNDNIGVVMRLSGNGNRGDLHDAIGDNSPELPKLVARVDALIKKHKDGIAAADQAESKAYDDMVAAAKKAWPDMAAKFTTETGFDPNNASAMKGKLIRFSTDNLMGWRFKPGDFPFATTINGLPVAGRYDPEVAKAIDDVQSRTPHTLGDSDYDGRWDVIARVEGTTGRMMTRASAEGDVKVDGQKVGTVTQEYSDPVDAPIITIVAAQVGPLAVAAGTGMAGADGAVRAPVGSTAGSTAGTAAVGSGGGGFVSWLWRLFVLVVGLGAAAACLMKANYAPLANVPQAGQMQSKLGNENLAIIGLICSALGVVFLLKGFIIYGLLTNLAIIAAGLYASLDWLNGRGIVKNEFAAQVRPLGVPIGLACAALVVMSLLLALIGVNLRVI